MLSQKPGLKINTLKKYIMRTKILSLVIVAVFIGSAPGFAQPQNQGQMKQGKQQQKAMMMKHHNQQKSMFQKFFTEEQQEAMKALRLEGAKKVKPFKNQLRELMAHQQTLTTADNADLKAIDKNIDEMAKAKAEIAKIMAAQHQQIRSLLTEEQLIKFDNMKGMKGMHRMQGNARPMQKNMYQKRKS